jgi:hypothetical protein
MTNNLFSGSNIILDQIERGLQNAKKEGNLSIDYSKIKIFTEAFKKAAGYKFQIAKYEIKGLMSKVRGECSISSKDFEIIEKILMGIN